MTGPRKITLRIGSLVLEGASRGAGAPLAAALKAELGRLLSAPGALPPAFWSGPRRYGRIDAGSFAPPAPALRAGGASRIAAAAGTSIARNVHRSLTGGKSR